MYKLFNGKKIYEATETDDVVDGVRSDAADAKEAASNAKDVAENVSTRMNSYDTTITNTLTAATQALDLASTASDRSLDAKEAALNATAAVAAMQSAVTSLQQVVPAQATPSNQLADKDFVNSSIATNTANFIGTFNSLAELQAYTGVVTNNDYAFVITRVDGNTVYNRYKYNSDSNEWIYEYPLNNSSFTTEQWNAINSGVTADIVAGLKTPVAIYKRAPDGSTWFSVTKIAMYVDDTNTFYMDIYSGSEPVDPSLILSNNQEQSGSHPEYN